MTSIFVPYVLSKTEFPPPPTQPNVGSRKETPNGGKRESEERLLASGTPRVGLCHSGTSASACVLHLSFKSSCPEFT